MVYCVFSRFFLIRVSHFNGRLICQILPKIIIIIIIMVILKCYFSGELIALS